MSDDPRPDYRGLLKRSLAAIDDLTAKLDASERIRTEPIAIIGGGCRFPGGANDLESFWAVLRTGVDAVTEAPPDRWDADRFYDPDPDAPGKAYNRSAAFLKEVDRFDPQFFGISPREAVSMDPQQRLLLEVTWEALEHAGVAPAALAGSSTAVYVGLTTDDYRSQMIANDWVATADAYAASGTAHSMAAGRLSYLLGLHGPNVAIDTACSSSLVAIHLGMQSLRTGEADLALAGGVNLMLTPDGSILLSRARMMSVTGRCRTFDAGADGYVRGEGCGILVLKRLADAERDRDRILAVLRGSALNQDGRSSGLTAPNGPAQEAVIRAALANARLQPADIGYVETHGTGTALGDPIEVKALGEVYGPGRAREEPLWIGSVKTNIGHLEGAAGVAGVMKAILALHHREIPPHLHFVTPNPHVPWDRYPVAVPIAPTPWAAPSGAKRRAGVSSFGFSGTNAHLILEEAPSPAPSTLPVHRPQHVLMLSAQTPAALAELGRRFAGFLDRPDAPPLADIAATAGRGRSHFSERLALVAASTAEARDQLANLTNGGGFIGRVQSGTPEVVFVFTGQGAQYAGMAHHLYQTQPSFRRILDQCALVLDRHLDVPLLSVLFGDPENSRLLDDTRYTQPALFAVEYALAQLWRSWGVEPTAVMGHSVGEYVAACIAGVFSLDDGLALIAERGRLMSQLPKNGGMAVVFAPESRVRAVIEADPRPIAIAAINGPDNVVISGLVAAVDTAIDRFNRLGIKSQRLNVSHAFHSPLMDPTLDEFEARVAGVALSPPRIELVSNLTGHVAGSEIATASYWRRHVREPVRFADSIRRLDQDGYRIFLEIGPTPTLVGMARTQVPDDGRLWLASLRKGRDDWASMLESLGALYVRGVKIDWVGFERDYAAGRQRVVLPTYPFQRERYWHALESRALDTPLNRTRVPHPLLDGSLNSPLKIFETRLRTADLPYLLDHRIFGMAIVPATAYVEMALAAGREVFGTPPTALEHVEIYAPLHLKEDQPATVQVVVIPNGSRNATFQIYSPADRDGETEPGEEWRLHASGALTLEPVPPVNPISLQELRRRQPDDDAITTYYQRLELLGAEYGPAFRALTEMAPGNGVAVGRVRLPDQVRDGVADYLIHPVLLDAGLQLIGATLDGDGTGDLYIPIGFGAVRVHRSPGADAWCQAVLSPGNGRGNLTAQVTLVDDDGTVYAEVADVQLRRVTRRTLERLLGHQPSSESLLEVVWRPSAIASPSAPPATGRWLIFADDDGVAAELAERFRDRGQGADVIADVDQAPDPTPGWSIDRRHPDAIRRVLDAAALRDPRPLLGVVYCARNDHEPLERLTLERIRASQAGDLHGALRLTQELVDAGTRLHVVTRGSQAVAGSIPDVVQAPLWGLGGVIASEYPDLGCTRIDLDPEPDPNAVDLLLEALGRADGENQIAFRGGKRYLARLVPSGLHSRAADTAVRLEIPVRGQLDNLALQPMVRTPPGAGQVEIEVHATGLNFRDVLNALGLYPGDPGPLGNECAGVITAIGTGVDDLRVGDEVIAMIDQSFATYVIAPATLTVRKPKNLGFAEAAAIPVAFLTADYALNHLGRMRAGDRVLIHAVTGGVGMAAVQLARRAGAEIFGTAGNPTKRALAQSQGVHHVADSRSLDFARQVREDLRGEGIDIALNSLAGDFIPASLDLLKPGGRFIEIGKTGIWDPASVAAHYPGVDYHVLYLGEVTAADPRWIRQRLIDLVNDFETGALEPLPLHRFPLDEAAAAYRFMAQAKHTGKIVLTQRHGTVLEPNATYLITGGLGGLGLEVARWMARAGAQHLALMGRRPPGDPAREALAVLERAGVEIRVFQGDVAVPDDVTSMFERMRSTMPPLRGIVHAAGIVRDATLPEQTWPSFEAVLAPKVSGAWNLHLSSESTPLDFFVLFASGAAVLGSPGQANYAAANAFLDALAQARHARGLPALSIDWGSWAEVGMAAAVGDRHRQRWAAFGLREIAPADGIQTLEDLLLGARSPQIAVLPLNRSKLAGVTQPFLSELVTEGPSAASGPSTSLAGQLTSLSRADRLPLVLGFLQAQLVRVFALDPAHRIETDRSIMDMGIDSLMAMELRNRITTALKISVPVANLLLGPTLEQLADELLDRLDLPSAPPEGDRSVAARSGPPGDDDADLLAKLDTLSDDDLDSHLERILTEREATDPG